MATKTDLPEMPIWEYHGTTEEDWVARSGPGQLCRHEGPRRHVITVDHPTASGRVAVVLRCGRSAV